jgi:hypothetical protein
MKIRLKLPKIQIPDIDLEELWVTFATRIVRLGGMIIKIPELWVFVLMFGLSWIPEGFHPLWFITDKPGEWVWLRGVINGFMLVWTIAFTSFIQRDENQTVWNRACDTQWSYDTNKDWTMYGFAILVWLVFVGLERWLTGNVTWWWMGVCAFLQITPLFMGDSLKEQARHLGPALTGITMIIVTAWFLAVG